MCVGQRKNGSGEERVVLFVKLHPDFSLTQDLLNRLVVTIRSQLTARHVPAHILPITDIPVSIAVQYSWRHITGGGSWLLDGIVGQGIKIRYS